MSAFTRVSEKGQVVVPKAARERLGWHAGTELEIVESVDAITLRPRRSEGRIGIDEAMARLRDIYRHKGPPLSVEALNWSVDGEEPA